MGRTFNPNCSAKKELMIEIAAPVLGVATTNWSLTLIFIFIAVVEIGSVACTSGILFRLVFSAVSTSREKSVCLLDMRDPTVVFTGAFHRSGMMSYGFVGGKDST